jgi:hypothetical protein
VRPALQLQRTSLHDAHPACWACGGYGCDFNSVVREKWQDEAELMRAQRAVRCCCCARVSASSSEANNEQEGATKQCAAVLPSGRPQCMRNSEDAEGFTFNTACFPSENSDGQTRSVLSVLEVTPAVGAKDQATPTQPLSRTTEAGAVREEHTQGTCIHPDLSLHQVDQPAVHSTGILCSPFLEAVARVGPHYGWHDDFRELPSAANVCTRPNVMP